MLKVGILSLYYNNSNFGGLLQAYALQKAIEELGYEAEEIKYDMYSYNKQKFVLRDCFRKKYYFLKRYKWVKRNQKFKRLQKKFEKSIPHSKKVRYKNLKKLNSRYDIFVCGSDQIWNPIGWQPAFFFEFVDKSKKKIAYAASLARDTLTSKEIDTIIENTRNFSAVSVREQVTYDILKTYINSLDVKVMPDPVFLLQTQNWESLTSSKRFSDKPYFFAYFLGNSSDVRDNAIKFAKTNGKRIYFISDMDYSNYEWEKNHKKYLVNSVSVTDFLSLIQNAEAVITDSFHGVAFSIIFERPFVCVRRFRENDPFSMNSRLDTLLSYFDFYNRLSDSSKIQIHEYSNSEREKLSIVKKELRQIGLAFLKDSLFR